MTATNEDRYPDALPLREALQRYFSHYHFKDGGYTQKWFTIKAGPLGIRVPNIPARVKAVKIHDIHHVLLEYRADWQGEVEIAGWEIGSGCGPYWVAWLLNAGSFVVGLFLFPRALFRGFRRGRAARTNLYHGVIYDQALLDTTVGELRKRIFST